MKNLLTSAIVIIVLIFSGATQAQTKSKSPKLENSLLWEVSGKGLVKPSYLYGTIHSICPADYFLSQKTKDAFQKSEKLIIEIDFSDPNELEDAQKLAVSSVPLSKKLSSEQFSKLDAILQRTTGLKLHQVDNYSLSTVMSLITIKTFECETVKSYEIDFMDLAKREQKPIMGFETVKSQMDMLSKAYSDSELITTLDNLSVENTKKMVQDYKNENLDNLYDNIAGEQAMSKSAKKGILDERNKDWIRKMALMVKKESLFVAVGSAHLAGDEGLINLLRKTGYIVKPIMN